jgi:hypothetical protein
MLLLMTFEPPNHLYGIGETVDGEGKPEVKSTQVEGRYSFPPRNGFVYIWVEHQASCQYIFAARYRTRRQLALKGGVPVVGSSFVFDTTCNSTFLKAIF